MAKLFIYPYSPYSQRVMFAMEEMGFAFTPVVVNLGQGEHMKSPFKETNPYRRVPVYKTTQLTLSESRSIIRHLASNPEMSQYWPSDPESRASVDQWMEYLGTHFGNHMSSLAWEKFFASQYGSSPDTHVIGLLEKKLERELPVVERQLTNKNWICGHQLTLAEFVLLPHIANMPLAGINMARWPAIQDWYLKTSSLNSWKKVMTTVERLSKN